MSSYDKQRKQWIVRFRWHGERIFVGRFHTQTEAELAEKLKRKELASMPKPIVKVTLNYEDTKPKGSFLQAIKDGFMKRRNERRKNKAVVETIEKI